MTDNGDDVKKVKEIIERGKQDETISMDTLKIKKNDYEALMALAKAAGVQQTQAAQAAQAAAQSVQPVQNHTVGNAPLDKPQPITQETIQSLPKEQNVAGDYGDIMSKPTVLYFDTDRTCTMLNVKLSKDGSVQIDDRMFDFTEGSPTILKIGGKSHPFYMLKYDNMIPLDVTAYGNSNPTPEQATRLVNLRTLETLSAIAGGKIKKTALIILMGAAFMGGIVVKLILSMLNVW